MPVLSARHRDKPLMVLAHQCWVDSDGYVLDLSDEELEHLLRVPGYTFVPESVAVVEPAPAPEATEDSEPVAEPEPEQEDAPEPIKAATLTPPVAVTKRPYNKKKGR